MQINAKQFLQWGRETVRILCRLLFQVSRLDLIFRCDCSDVFHHMPHCVYLIDLSSFALPKVQFVHRVRSVCFRILCMFCSVRSQQVTVLSQSFANITIPRPILSWAQSPTAPPHPPAIPAPCNSCLCLAFVIQITATLSLRCRKAFVCLFVCVCVCVLPCACQSLSNPASTPITNLIPERNLKHAPARRNALYVLILLMTVPASRSCPLSLHLFVRCSNLPQLHGVFSSYTPAAAGATAVAVIVNVIIINVCLCCR